MKVVKRILLVLLVSIAILALVLVLQTSRFRSKQVHVSAVTLPQPEKNLTSQRLAEALRFRTISDDGEKQMNADEFRALQNYLERAFPNVKSKLSREIVADYSLLYVWKGTESNSRPILLMAHLDVVPADVKDGWQQPPFDGQISEGYVWGRGAMDDKASVLGILESVEFLIGEGFEPKRTIYFAFGHDEEVGGRHGALKIAALLQSRNLQFEYILDEGLFVADGMVKGLSKPVALIGVAEKGFLNVELQVEAAGGHSSLPPSHTSIGILSAAIKRLEDNPMPAHLEGPTLLLFDYVGPEMNWNKKLVFANLWLFKPIVEKELSGSPTTNASIRTTAAVTMIEGGIKDNVLPTRAKAIVNFRILPGDSIESVLSHLSSTIQDSRVKISRYGTNASEPSPIANTQAAGFQILQRTVREVFSNTLVAPALLVGATDSRHYQGLSQNIYRFTPQVYRTDDLARFHGRDERISSEAYSQSIRFYYQLIKNSNEETPPLNPD